MSIEQEKKVQITSEEEVRTHGLSRPPLTTFGKLARVALITGGVATLPSILVVQFLVGFPHNLLNIIASACLFLSAGLISTRLRWMPPVVTLLSVLVFTLLLMNPFIMYFLTHPKAEPEFPAFMLSVVAMVSVFVAFCSSIGATVQNYRQKSNQAPRWLRSALSLVAGIIIGAILLAALEPSPGISTTIYPTVHMGGSRFLQTSVVIARGSDLVLVNDSPAIHVVENGSGRGANGVARPHRESGAPLVDHIQVSGPGNSVEIGPFNTTGTYHIYCEDYSLMTMTIIVQ